MRGGAWWWIFIGLLCSVDYINGYALKCDRIPDGAGATKSPADGRFRIRIEGNPERYKPNEVYNSKWDGNARATVGRGTYIIHSPYFLS